MYLSMHLSMHGLKPYSFLRAQMAKKQKPSLDDLLSLTSASAGTPVIPEKQKKEKNRPQLKISKQMEGCFEQLILSKYLNDAFSGSYDSSRKELNEVTMDAWAELVFETHTQPENPKIAMDGLEGMFVVTTKFKVQIPDDKQPKESLIELLSTFLNTKKSVQLVEEEIYITQQLMMRDLNELANGRKDGDTIVAPTEIEKSTAKKLLSFLFGYSTNPLTEAERDVVFYRKGVVQVRNGFIKRCCNYVENADQLKKLFKVIEPQPQNRQLRFSADVPNDVFRKKLCNFATQICAGIDKTPPKRSRY